MAAVEPPRCASTPPGSNRPRCWAPRPPERPRSPRRRVPPRPRRGTGPAHALADVRGIKDTSRQGRWHNARFKALAAELGIAVTKDPRLGWSPTTLPAPTRAAYAAYADTITVLGAALRMHRSAELTGGRGTKIKPPPPCVCGCGRRVRSPPPCSPPDPSPAGSAAPTSPPPRSTSHDRAARSGPGHPTRARSACGARPAPGVTAALFTTFFRRGRCFRGRRAEENSVKGLSNNPRGVDIDPPAGSYRLGASALHPATRTTTNAST